MRKLLLAAVAALSIGYARLFGGPMDDTAWEVKIKGDSLFAFSHPDTLIFRRGRLSMAGFIASGFEPAVYSAQSVAGDSETIWNASLEHPDRGVVSLQGLVRGDQVEGVAVWWTRDGKLKKFTFRGSRKLAQI